MCHRRYGVGVFRSLKLPAIVSAELAEDQQVGMLRLLCGLSVGESFVIGLMLEETEGFGGLAKRSNSFGLQEVADLSNPRLLWF